MHRNLGLSTGLVALLALVFHVSPIGSDAKQGSSQTVETKTKSGRSAAPTDRINPVQDSEFDGPWLATRLLTKDTDANRKKPECDDLSPTCTDSFREFL